MIDEEFTNNVQRFMECEKQRKCESIIDGLPGQIRDEVIQQSREQVYKNYKFFSMLDSDETRWAIFNFMESKVYFGRETLYDVGDLVSSVYLII